MDERATDGTEPPRPLAAALGACDVYIAPTTRSLSHTTARKRATDAGDPRRDDARASPRTCSRASMAVDFDTMAALARAVAALLDDASSAHVSCPRGTDLTLDLTARAGSPTTAT